jgi:predicted thioesterase
MPARPGLTSSVELTVTEGDTALAMSTGDVPMLATPRIIALVEEATVAALDGELQPGCTSVCMRVQVEHISPTPVGAKIRAEVTLERVEGRRLSFSVSARDDRGLVAAGRVTRVVVDRGHFLEKAR